MAKDQLRNLHLFAMESALPFGMGILEDVKTGGIQKVMGVLKSKDPFSEFQVDGENSAKALRDKIEQMIPGFGYPVVSVDVTVAENYPDYENNDEEALVSTLNRIDTELDQLKRLIRNDSSKIDDK